MKDEVDSCPAKRQFDFWLSAIFGGCPLTFILTEDEDRSTEYIGVSLPCILKLIIELTQNYNRYKHFYTGYDTMPQQWYNDK